MEHHYSRTLKTPAYSQKQIKPNCINSITHLAYNAFKANSLIIAFMSALLLEVQSISYFEWVLKSMYTAFPQDRLLT